MKPPKADISESGALSYETESSNMRKLFNCVLSQRRPGVGKCGSGACGGPDGHCGLYIERAYLVAAASAVLAHLKVARHVCPPSGITREKIFPEKKAADHKYLLDRILPNRY